MTLENLLETFDARGQTPVAPTGQTDPNELEGLRSESYDAGYASGWEDALKSDTEARNRVEAEFERNIQNLVFTYTEAVDCIRGEVKNFVSAIIEGFLPEIVPDLTREHLRNELLKVADNMIEAPVEIVTSSDSKPLLEDLLDNEFSLNIALVEDNGLAPRQVFIRIAEREIEVNVDPMIEALRKQFQALAETNEGRAEYG